MAGNPVRQAVMIDEPVLKLGVSSCAQVEVVNLTRLGLDGACIVLQSFVVAPSGQQTDRGDSRRFLVAHAAANAATPVAGGAVTQAAAGVTFVFLLLHAADGRQLSRNAYWLADPQVIDHTVPAEHFLLEWQACEVNL